MCFDVLCYMSLNGRRKVALPASPAQSNPNGGPAGLSVARSLSFSLSAAVNLISETVSDRRRQSLTGKHKEKDIYVAPNMNNNASIQVQISQCILLLCSVLPCF